MAEGRRRSATTAERLGRMLVIVPYLVQHPGYEPRRGVAVVRRAGRAAAQGSGPAVHVGASTVRAGRPDRRRRRRGRMRVDLDGRPFRATVAADAPGSAGRLRSCHRVARDAGRAAGARARRCAREAPRRARRRHPRRRVRHRGGRGRKGAGAPRCVAGRLRGASARSHRLRGGQHRRAVDADDRARGGLRERRALVRGRVGRGRRRRTAVPDRPGRLGRSRPARRSSHAVSRAPPGRSTRRGRATRRSGCSCALRPDGWPSTTRPPTCVSGTTGRSRRRSPRNRPDGSPGCSCGWRPRPRRSSPASSPARSANSLVGRSLSTGARGSVRPARRAVRRLKPLRVAADASG